ncbi:type II secretion system protein GspM [Thiolapillus sp.]
MNLQGRKQRCVLVLGGVGLLALLVLGLIAYPWWSRMQFYDQAVNQAADHIQRYQRLLDSAPEQRKRLKDLRQQLRKRKYFVSAANPELAAAELQKRVKSIVTEAQGKLVSTQKVDSREDGATREIKIKVRMKGDVDALARVLHELEGRLPVVTIDNVSIRSRRTVKGRRKNRVEGYELDVSFELVGYMLAGGAGK